MSSSEKEITIDQIVESFSARLEKGQRPSIDEYVLKYPQHAKQIEAVLPALVALENVDSQPNHRKLVVDDSIPEVFGDYRIIQEIGRGGMGIVLEAEHATMRRRVALKVLPKSLAERPNYLNRFLTEARSAGQLHHTNIVPVFEVGEAAGLNFYAMQYIHGDNLDRVIQDVKALRDERRGADGLAENKQARHEGLSHTLARELFSVNVASEVPQSGAPQNDEFREVSSADNDLKTPNGKRDTMAAQSEREPTTVFAPTSSSVSRTKIAYHHRVAAVGVQVAEALDYAHHHGVLHRDVKPANLILDTDGNVWITDFGLAKFDAHDLTQTGDIVGTLRYMAPERFAGEADPRSDIYSLGLSLYELCTLRCAFDASRGTMVQEVVDRSTVVCPRAIDDTIPADLETIILKSIEPQPERRYQSAAALAEDLQLFLADRPIKARRASWLEKCWRICRRNPVASTLTACIACMLVMIAAGSFHYAQNEIKERKQSQKSLYFSKLDQAKMRRLSQRPGQRFETIGAINDAANLLPKLDFDSGQRREALFNLRSEFVAAMSLTDLEQVWSYETQAAWGVPSGVVFDSSGERYAIGNVDGRIQVRNSEDHQVIVELPAPRTSENCWSMKFSPDSRFLVASYHPPNAGRAKMLMAVWELAQSDEPIFESTATFDYCFSDDSCFLAVAFAKRCDVVELATKETVNTMAPTFVEDATPRRVMFNHDASTLAVSKMSAGVVEFWSVEPDPQLIRTVETPQNVYSMDWDSKRELFVTGGTRGNLYFWRGSLDDDPEELELHQNTIFRVDLHPDQELVVTSAWDATSRLTDLLAKKEVLRMENVTVLDSGFSANARIGFIQGASIGMWEIAKPVIDVYSGTKGGVRLAAFHPRYPHVVARTADDSVEFWDTNEKRILFVQNEIVVKEIAFSENGEKLFLSTDEGLKRWDVEIAIENDHTSILIGNPVTWIDRATNRFDVTSDGKTMVVGVGTHVRAVDLDTGALGTQFVGHHGLSHMYVTADDRYLLTGTWHGHGIKIWDMKSGELLDCVDEETESSVVVPHPFEADVFYAGRDKIQKYRFDGSQALPFAGVKRRPYKGVLQFSEDKVLCASSSNFHFSLFDSNSDEPFVEAVTKGQSRIVKIVFSSDSQKMALVCFDSLQIVDLKKIKDELAKLGLPAEPN
ncbi:serine/threonine-protein kinase [bacterium]|nr:serine/threonine-protein kinase [bacterium]